MPWQCTCGVEVGRDDLAMCPGCGLAKSAWSVVAKRTRTMVVSTKKVELLRGTGTRALPVGDPALGGAEVVPAEEVRPVEKAALRGTLDAGLVPASQDVLFVRLHPKGSRDLTVFVAPAYDKRETPELAFEPFGPPADVVDVPFIFVHGDGDASTLQLPGVHVVDITEATPRGCALTVELSALKRPPRSLPVRTASARVVPRLVDPRGRPVALTWIHLARGPERAVDAPYFTDREGRLGLPIGEGLQAGPPADLSSQPAGEEVWLHWSYAPRTREELAKLPARSWSPVVIAETITLRPSRLRGSLRLRLLEHVADGEPRPLGATGYRLVASDRTVEGTTDAAGCLFHASLPLVTWRLEAAGYETRLDITGDTEGAVDVVLGEPIARSIARERVPLSSAPHDDQQEASDEEEPEDQDEPEPAALAPAGQLRSWLLRWKEGR